MNEIAGDCSPAFFTSQYGLQDFDLQDCIRQHLPCLLSFFYRFQWPDSSIAKALRYAGQNFAELLFLYINTHGLSPHPNEKTIIRSILREGCGARSELQFVLAQLA
ncbi:MAG: hypothetical protein QM744_02755 [Mesorhizobium sp.]